MVFTAMPSENQLAFYVIAVKPTGKTDYLFPALFR